MDVSMEARNSWVSNAEVSLHSAGQSGRGIQQSNSVQDGGQQVHGSADTALKTTVNEINRKLQSVAPNTRVVYDVDKQSHRIWLNIIDKQTGKILSEIPPETVRQILKGTVETKGLLVNKGL